MKKFIFTLALLFAAIFSSHAQYDVNNGDSKVTVTGDDGKQIVNIVQEPQSDRLLVEVLGMRLQLRNKDSEDDSRSVYKPKFNPHGGHLALFEFGYNYIQPAPDYFYLDMIEADNYSFMERKSWKSINSNITLSKISLNLDPMGFTSLTFGFQISVNRHELPNNIRLEKQNGMIIPVKVDEPYRSSFISNTGFRFPIIFEVNDVPFMYGAKKHTDWFVSLGVHLDIIAGSTAITRKPKTELVNLYHNPVQLGFNARLGWGNYYIYFTSNVTNLFKDNRGPMFNYSTVGIGLFF